MSERLRLDEHDVRRVRSVVVLLLAIFIFAAFGRGLPGAQTAPAEGPAFEGKTEKERLLRGRTMDLNRARVEDLVLIQGVGEKTAEQIVQYRVSHGGFTELGELEQVKGIGPVLSETIARYARVGSANVQAPNPGIAE